MRWFLRGRSKECGLAVLSSGMIALIFTIWSSGEIESTPFVALCLETCVGNTQSLREVRLSGRLRDVQTENVGLQRQLDVAQRQVSGEDVNLA